MKNRYLLILSAVLLISFVFMVAVMAVPERESGYRLVQADNVGYNAGTAEDLSGFSERIGAADEISMDLDGDEVNASYTTTQNLSDGRYLDVYQTDDGVRLSIDEHGRCVGFMKLKNATDSSARGATVSESTAADIAAAYLGDRGITDMVEDMTWYDDLSQMYSFRYVKSVGGFATCEECYVDVGTDGEVCGYTYSKQGLADGIPTDAVLMHTRSEVEGAAIDDMKTIYGELFRSAEVAGIRIEKIGDRWYFNVSISVEYAAEGAEVPSTDTESIYYEVA